MMSPSAMPRLAEHALVVPMRVSKRPCIVIGSMAQTLVELWYCVGCPLCCFVVYRLVRAPSDVRAGGVAGCLPPGVRELTLNLNGALIARANAAASAIRCPRMSVRLGGLGSMLLTAMRC